jgi:hypothetical protein
MLCGRSDYGESDLYRAVFAEAGENLPLRHARTCNVFEFQVNEEGRDETGWIGNTPVCKFLLCARVEQFSARFDQRLGSRIPAR